MKTIGILGGLSWESTQHYYQIMNQYVQRRLGGFHSLKSLIYSFNFEEIIRLLDQDDWGRVAQMLVEGAKKLEAAGADLLIMACNSVHVVAYPVQSSVQIPLLHIVDPTAEAIKQSKFRKIGLLGTKYTMEEDFYRERLEDKHRIEVFLPEPEERDLVDKVIFEELVLGKIRSASEKKYQAIIQNLKKKGAQGVILGCTEIGLLVPSEESSIPLFDTAELHGKAAVDFALS